ncbi:FkbM family methyltransferase [Methylocystis sp. SC2]|uniref:FkbM family methyltransferase n=1 Tax=Methylocystis sp. (strain SC2) TaxID=187303 RepID=UPI00027AF3D2|nr:FkbM family methyltransferase [Methylocystis sp. SC2]CCJ07833.1 Methyltransferase FkbM family [Methylocystis sp. SC2]
MNPFARLVLELGQLRQSLDMGDFLGYCAALAGNAGAVVKYRTLAPVDKAMRGTIAFVVEGVRILVPLDAMARMLNGHDETPTFGGAREMYASNVYLRAFRKGLKADTVVDLGSNRGLFLLLGAKALGARTLVGVEPQSFYTPVFAAAASANGLQAGDYTRYERFASATLRADTITLREIMERHGLSRIGFLKCDIEGGEFDVFLGDPDALRQVDNIGMELHPKEGDADALVRTLKDMGFTVVVTDQFANSVAPAKGHYLYASRTGDLA